MIRNDWECVCGCHVDPMWHYKPCCHLCVLCKERVKVGYEKIHEKNCPGYKELRKKERNKKKGKRND